LVAGAYRLDGILLRGDRAMIVAATHVQLAARVVLELAWPARIDSTLVQCFLHDARAASELSSRHVARVLDAGALDDGGFYVATTYVEGDDVGTAIAQRGAFSAREAAAAMIPVCEALAEMHAAELVHRDLELANLRVTPAGIVLVGHARLTSLLQAPAADARDDIFALGRILFAMVRGHSGVALRARSDLPQGFVAIVERCLQSDPARRYQRASDVASALAVFTAPQPVREAPRFTSANLVAIEADRLR
jgi:serine/threonine-protein kinase